MPRDAEPAPVMMSDAPEQQPTRRHPRVSLPKGMWVAWYAGTEYQISRVGTLGMGGIFIHTPNPPPVGTEIRLAFEVPKGEVRAEGIVRSSKPGEGMGLEFTKVGPRDRVILQQLMKRLLR